MSWVGGEALGEDAAFGRGLSSFSGTLNQASVSGRSHSCDQHPAPAPEGHVLRLTRGRGFPYHPSMPETPQIGPDEVQKVARLSRLEVGDADASTLAGELGAILAFMEGLKSVDVEGVRPMTHPDDEVNRLAEDEPSGGVSRDAFLAMAPETMGAFVRVPKVIDGGGSA